MATIEIFRLKYGYNVFGCDSSPFSSVQCRIVNLDKQYCMSPYCYTQRIQNNASLINFNYK